MKRQSSCSGHGPPALAWGVGLGCLLLLAASAGAQDQQLDLTQLSPEQLSKLEVTSVSKKQQKLSDTAAAVYVITQQDIHNSAATSIPELLRGVPGLDVAQISASVWAVSARGFTSQHADKMLVLIDGRSVFHPLFSGVTWNEPDLILEDIERIEIVRGPGATLWGTNAVNGVINIITKSSKDTKGGQVTAGAGNLERSSSSVRYGGRMGNSTSYRIYSKYADVGPNMEDAFGGSAHDSWRDTRGGFRLDTKVSERDTLMLEGDSYGGNFGAINGRFSYTPPFNFPVADIQGAGGTNLLANWIHKTSSSETEIEASYSHLAEPTGALDINGNLATLSLQYARPAGERHSIVAGLQFDYRAAQTSVTSPVIWFDPSRSIFRIASAFIQDEMLFANGAVHLTTGLRAEYNTLNGIGFQPNARLLWKINHVHSVWLSYSLANRSESPFDTSARINLAAFPGRTGLQVLRFVGNPDILPERVNAFEMGYRIQPRKTLSFDLATFYNRYSRVLGTALGPPFFELGPPPRLVLPLVSQNNISGPSFGGEFTAHWAPVSRVRFTTAYSFIELDLVQTPSALGDNASQINGSTPRHKLALDNSVNLARTVSLSTALSFADRRTALRIPGYTLVDSTLVWCPKPAVELRIGAKNLFNKEHPEFIAEGGTRAIIMGRSFYAKTTWRFGGR